ncbi:Hydroxyisourate hydrolase [Decorospora gaudefroyi]|uniref:5-hydroxyisourate hydrolase n=1 Tax=Decorospora gaudefroyi TaxID=184978 RepID=A0A6A5KRM1_9PLEO|nr:Hydroxyisourate hydrolase [Decorospora gaudefroyi]
MTPPTSLKPPITCHVLDTTLGRPGANIPVTLTYHGTTTSPSSTSPPPTFTATTNADGRITSWTPQSTTLREIFDADAGTQKFSLRFDTAAYWEGRGVEDFFFGEVEVRFLVREGARGEHFHVPVLLGPFSYCTYRGS